jgi:transcriptional regulator with GAF, ATPase, and Fis domain
MLIDVGEKFSHYEILEKLGEGITSILTHPIKNQENLYEFAKILGQQSDFQEILRLVAQKSVQLVNAEMAFILMINPDTRHTIKTIMKNGQSSEQKAYREIHIHVGGWNQSRAARLLQISEKNIRYRMDLLDIRKPG